MPSITLLLALCASPLPDEASIKQAQRAVLETYRDDLGSEEGLRRVLSAADGLTGADQVAAYLVVAKSAAQSGLLRIGFEAIDRLSRRFEYDAPAAKVSMLEGAVKRARTVQDRVSIVNRCLELLEQSVASESFDVGDDALKIASQVVAKIRDPELRKELSAKRKSFEAAKKEFEAEDKALDAARAALKRDERDPKANETMGRHLAARGDWSAAVLRLGRSDDEGLRRAAQADATASKDASRAVGAADSWWAVAESAEGKERSAFMRRATFWYAVAAPSLTGLAKARAEKRIEEAGNVDLSGQTIGDKNRMTVLLGPGAPLVMVRIPASEDGRVREFWLAATELTQSQWSSLMGGGGDAKAPKGGLGYEDCAAFLSKIKTSRFNFRFPTEEEIQYVWLAGKPEAMNATSLKKYAWTKANADRIHNVGELDPNKFGVFDLAGNVWEWIKKSTVIGGGYESPAVAFFDRLPLSGNETGNRPPNFGFRLAADLR